MSKSQTALHVVLVHPEIPGNTGTAGRTCLAAGAQLHLIHPLGFSVSDRQVRRAGLDYWSRVDPIEWPDWDSFEEVLPEMGTAYFFSAEGQRSFWDVSYPKPSVLIFGKEGGGFSAELRKRYAENLVSLPMQDPELRSVNLSTTVGIALYEVQRQWRAGD